MKYAFFNCFFTYFQSFILKFNPLLNTFTYLFGLALVRSICQWTKPLFNCFFKHHLCRIMIRNKTWDLPLFLYGFSHISETLYLSATNFNNHFSLFIAWINVFLSAANNSVTEASKKFIIFHWYFSTCNKCCFTGRT